MAQKESTFLNMVLTLFLVTLIAASVLGFVNDLTKDAIALSKKKAQEEAIIKVLPEFDKLEESYKVIQEEGGDSLELFPAVNAAGKMVGVAVKSYSKKGFGGNISLMVGFKADGTVSGYSVLEHKETPGLGSKMGDWFNNKDKPDQNIVGKNPKITNFTVANDGGDIDAITASTISSRAFLDGVMRAYNAFMKNATDANSGATTKKEVKDESAK